MRSITSALLAATLTGALALSAVQGFAQDQGGQMSGQNDARRACMRDAMAKLNLTDDQKSQLKALRESGQKGEDRRAAMAKILTPNQQAQLRDARKACGGGQGGGQG